MCYKEAIILSNDEAKEYIGIILNGINVEKNDYNIIRAYNMIFHSKERNKYITTISFKQNNKKRLKNKLFIMHLVNRKVENFEHYTIP